MRALRIALLLVVAAEVCLFVVALASPENTLPAGSDLPREQRVSGWRKAAELARTVTFEPTYVPGGARPTLTVRGIPGDSSRPLAAEYGNGLLVRQAHVEVDPQLEDELAEVEGADDAWWGMVREKRYLYVVRGETPGNHVWSFERGSDPDRRLAEARGGQQWLGGAPSCRWRSWLSCSRRFYSPYLPSVSRYLA